MDKSYERLANGIIVAAAKDYKKALKTLEKYPDSIMAKIEIDNIEQFFHSEWYAFLTDVDPDYIMKNIKKNI